MNMILILHDSTCCMGCWISKQESNYPLGLPCLRNFTYTADSDVRVRVRVRVSVRVRVRVKDSFTYWFLVVGFLGFVG